jgi:hypothetical protein
VSVVRADCIDFFMAPALNTVAVPAAAAPHFETTEQCGNAAYGVCQTTANDPKQSPCGNMFNGWQKCSKSEFWSFYGGKLRHSFIGFMFLLQA